MNQQHFHHFAPGDSLNQQPMLFCDCGTQVNCAEWKSAVGAGMLHYRQHVAMLGMRILREERGE